MEHAELLATSLHFWYQSSLQPHQKICDNNIRMYNSSIGHISKTDMESSYIIKKGFRTLLANFANFLLF